LSYGAAYLFTLHLISLLVAVPLPCLVSLAFAQYLHIAEQSHIPIDHHVEEGDHASTGKLQA
jgi:hypothetical protein